MVDERDCITALQDAARELDTAPSKAQYEALGLTPASATIQRVMGSWNDAKRAAGLETSASTGSRTHPKPNDIDLPVALEWESLSVDQRWHYRNREWNTERSLRRRQRVREWLASYKRDENGCCRCDVIDPRTIDCHHPDPGAKELAVTEMVTNGYAEAAIQAEVDQCILLCANCHAKEHGSGKPTDPVETKAERLRAWASDYKRERGCVRCPETDPVCLEFHHPAEKHESVSRLISDSAPERSVYDEVDRCEVICANCHRLEHHPKRSGQSDRS